MRVVRLMTSRKGIIKLRNSLIQSGNSDSRELDEPK
jgi:hypothetical protein